MYTSAAEGNVAKGCDIIAIISQQLRGEIIMEEEVMGVRTSNKPMLLSLITDPILLEDKGGCDKV